MTDLLFERLGQIIAIGAVRNGIDFRDYYITECEKIHIKFSDYVKSQVHINIVYGLFGRSLKDYVEALWFLGGKTSCRASAEKVLRFFYLDMANFLKANSGNIQLDLEVDTEYFNLEKAPDVVLSELRQEVMQQVREVINGTIPIETWKHAKVLDYIADVQDLFGKPDSYCLAEVLDEAVNSEKLKIIRSVV